MKVRLGYLMGALGFDFLRDKGLLYEVRSVLRTRLSGSVNEANLIPWCSWVVLFFGMRGDRWRRENTFLRCEGQWERVNG